MRRSWLSWRTMKWLVDRNPDRFVGSVASLPLDDVEAAVREAERTVEDVPSQEGKRQIFSGNAFRTLRLRGTCRCLLRWARR